MRRLTRALAAAVLAVTVWFNVVAHRPPEEDVAEPEEEPTPTLPVYDDSDELTALDERRRAHEAGELAARKREAERTAARIAVAAKPKKAAAITRETPSRGSSYVGQAQSFTATAYTAYCAGCTGITRTGHDLRATIYEDGRRVIATDPRYIPLGSIVRVTLADGTTFEAVASDTGGAIKGAIIDIAHETTAEALEFGRQTVEVRMIRRGGR